MTKIVGYGQFCPVSMVSEVICARWGTLIIRELLCGSTRFNDLRRGLPRISPSLLSKRLKEFEKARIIRTLKNSDGINEYHLTESGEELRLLIVGIGTWGQRWVNSELSLKNLDPSLLMWDMRRNLRPEPMPPKRCTIHFMYPELIAATQNWWMIVEQDKVDLCRFDPGFEIDLMVTASLRDMKSVWMGFSDIRKEITEGRIVVDGDPALARTIQHWLGLSLFAPETRKVS